VSLLVSLPILFIITKRAFSQMHNQIYDLMELSAKTNENIHSNISGAMTLKQFNNESSTIKQVSSQIFLKI